VPRISLPIICLDSAARRTSRPSLWRHIRSHG